MQRRESAETVRRSWIAGAFLTRTTPPKGAETFLAVAVAHGEHTEDYHRLFCSLTGTSEDKQYWNASSTIAARAHAAAPRQAVMLALALLVCEWESTTSRGTWRNPKERDRRYLTALIGWGYQPSDVERLILDQPQDSPTVDTEPGDQDAPHQDAADGEQAEPVQDGEYAEDSEDSEDAEDAEPGQEEVDRA